MRLRFRGLFGRTVVGLASQVVNSVTNLALSIMVARSVSAADFGGWAVAYAIFVVLLAVNRAAISTPMMLLPESTSPSAAARTQNNGASAALTLGFGAGALLVAGAYAAPEGVSAPMMCVGGVLPGLLLHDYLRYVFLKRQRPIGALVLDLSFAVVQAAGFVVLVQAGLDSAGNLTLAWGAGAVVSSLTALLVGRNLPALSSTIQYFREHSHASLRLLADSVLTSVAANALPVVVASIVGLTAAGYLRAGQTLMGLLGLVVMGMTPLMTIEAVRMLEAGRSRWRILGLWSLFTAAAAAVVGVIVLNLPASLGRELLGDSWGGAQVVLVPLVIQGLLRGPFTGVPILLKASGHLDEVVRLRLRTSAVVFLVPAECSVLWGLQGAAWGLVLAGVWANFQSHVSLRRVGDVLRMPAES